jgi:hypothetical protein
MSKTLGKGGDGKGMSGEKMKMRNSGLVKRKSSIES